MDDRAVELMAGHLAGTLTESEGQELVGLATTDAEVRSALQLQEGTHRLLRARTSTTTNVAALIAALPRVPTSRRVLARLPRRMRAGPRHTPRWVAASAAALVLGVICWWSLRSETPSPPWTIAAIEGGAYRQVGDTRTALGRSDGVAVGQAIDVTTNGSVRLLGRDGTVLELSSASSVSVSTASSSERRMLLKEGRVRADVAKQRPDARFVLETPQVEITVVGTAFTATVTDQVTTVNVEEGAVVVKPMHGPVERLEAGNHKRWPVEVTPANTPAQDNEVVVKADADADADASQPSTSFGIHPGLQIRGGGKPRISLLRFTVPRGKVVRAQLILHRTGGNAAVQVHQQAVSGGWQENDLRWHHVPTKGRLIGTLREQAGLWVCDIPGLQPGLVELYMSAPAGQATFASREESGREPVLHIRLAP